MRTRGTFFSILTLQGLALCGSLAFPLPASAAVMESAWKACDGKDTPAAERIAQCSAIIASGKVKYCQLGLALMNRGYARVQQDNFAGAIADFDAALKQAPD